MVSRLGCGIQGGAREIDRACAIGFDHFLILHSDGINDMRRIHQLRPSAALTVRFYETDMMAKPGSVRAQEAARWLHDHEAWAMTAGVIPGNENNLSIEHGGRDQPFWHSADGYRAMDAWLIEWAIEFRRLIPTEHRARIKLHWPALAPGHEPPGTIPESEYGLLGASMDAFDVVDCHVYGPLADTWTGVGRLARIVPAINRNTTSPMPIHVTETNCLPCPPDFFRDFLEQAKAFPQVAAIDWFLWRGNPEHAAFDLAARPNDELERLRVYAATDTTVQPSISTGGSIVPPTTERTRYFKDLWTRFSASFVPGHALTDKWAELADSPTPLGPPMEPAHDTEDGQWVYQCFASGWLHVKKGDWTNVKRGLPPPLAR